MRKLLVAMYDALASIVTILTPEEPEPETNVSNTRTIKGGKKK